MKLANLIAEYDKRVGEARVIAEASDSDAGMSDEQSAAFDAAMDRADAVKEQIDALKRVEDASNALDSARRSEPAAAAVGEPTAAVSMSPADRDDNDPGAELAKLPDAGRENSAVGGQVRSVPRRLRNFRSEADAYQVGQWLRAVRGVPSARAWCREHGQEYRSFVRDSDPIELRIMQEGSNSAGGYLSPDVFQATLIDLQETFGVARTACQFVPMTGETMNIPKRVGGPTATWTGEGTAITASDASFTNVNLTAQKLATLTRVSNELLEDSAIDLADFVAGDSAKRLAEAEDDAWMNGDGTSTYGDIFGVASQLTANTGWAGSVFAASGDDTYAEITVGDLSSLIGALPSYASGGAAWYVHALGNAHVFERLGQAGGGTNVVTIGQGLQRQYSGYPVIATQKLSGSTGDLSNTTMLLFGDMSQACVFGQRRGVTVQMLTERYAEFNETALIVSERVDINAHDLGDASSAGAVVGLLGN